MKAIKILRKTFLQTRYQLECNDNLKIDFPAGRTNKPPKADQIIIYEHFSTALNLGVKRGAKLFAEYSTRSNDLRGNALWKVIQTNKSLFEIRGLTVDILGRFEKIFSY